jgi:hypothetical protein
VIEGSARIADGKSIATIRCSERADVEPIWCDVVAGIIRNVSVGYRVHRYEVEKRDGRPELWRAVDWEPLEISAVPVAADAGAHIRRDAALAPCVVVRDDGPAATPAAQRKRSEMPEKQTPVAGDRGDTIAAAADIRADGAPEAARRRRKRRSRRRTRCGARNASASPPFRRLAIALALSALSSTI